MSRRKLFILLAGLVFIGCDIAILTWYFTREPVSPSQEPTLSFDGSSDQLQHTVIVPTLDTPIPEGKSAIWCASFQIAWNKLKSDVAKGPVQIQGAEEIAKRLNDSPVTEADLPEGSYYAAAGRVSDGIVEAIQAEMPKRFPRVPVPTFQVFSGSVLAYAYLDAEVKYRHPFLDHRAALIFAGGHSDDTKVRSFGVPPDELRAGDELRNQPTILWQSRDQDAFIVDPSWESPSNQVILARIPRSDSLADSVAFVMSRLPKVAWGSFLREQDSLLVPNMAWRREQHFRELEGRGLLNPTLGDLHVGQALQAISFKLDRHGAGVTSEARIRGDSKPDEVRKREYHFNRPFLILLKKRGAAQPFFVMWVDNAELLQKWGE